MPTVSTFSVLRSRKALLLEALVVVGALAGLAYEGPDFLVEVFSPTVLVEGGPDTMVQCLNTPAHRCAFDAATRSRAIHVTREQLAQDLGRNRLLFALGHEDANHRTAVYVAFANTGNTMEYVTAADFIPPNVVWSILKNPDTLPAQEQLQRFFDEHQITVAQEAPDGSEAPPDLAHRMYASLKKAVEDLW